MAETPGAGAQREFVDQILRGHVEPEASDLPTAATVVLVRDGERGPEVLLMLRPERTSFSGAWVFPGGKVEDIDAAADDDATARNAAARETAEEVGLVVAPDALVHFATFVPPPALPLRIRTWFFAAAAPAGSLVLHAGEVVSGEWMRPEDMLRLHAAGDATLYPPTYITLAWLSGASAAAALLERLVSDGPAEYRTRVTKQADGLLFHWDPDDGTDAAAVRHRLDTTALPWSYSGRPS